MKVCLLLCTYNRPDYLRRCLDSLKQLIELPDLLVVMDDASDQEAKLMVQSFNLDCDQRHFYKSENLGIKDSILKGCQYAFDHGCDLVINLDSDAIVKPNLITELVRLKTKFPDKIISGFNCNHEHNPVLSAGKGFVVRKRANGINLCFDKQQFDKAIKPALKSKGDWDQNVKSDFIITSPSLVQHIGKESAMGHPMFDQACDFDLQPERTITIIHPSKGRPKEAGHTAWKWMSFAKDRDRIQYLISLDEGENIRDYHEGLHQTPNDFRFEILVNDNRSAIEAINTAAKSATGDLFIVVSDDFDCPYHWDELLISCLKGKEDFVVKTDDGTQPWIITLPIMDRKYYNRFGYIYNQSYSHMFCDTEMTHVADLLDRKLTLPITFRHNHYSTGLTPKDSINEKNDSTWAQGENVYLEGVKNNFWLKKELIRGKLSCDQSHYEWLKSKGIEPDVRPLLTILIPTVNGRETEFDTLVKSLLPQINFNPDVEMLCAKDNKEMSIGAKRQGLLQAARGVYFVMIDDDDRVAPDYIETVLAALKEAPDSVGYLECVNGDQVAAHSNSFSEWAQNIGDYDYVRTPFYKTPMKTEIGLKIGFSDMRYGEDKDFADRLKASGLIQKEVFIPKRMYFYTYEPLSQEAFNERYGIHSNK